MYKHEYGYLYAMHYRERSRDAIKIYLKRRSTLPFYRLDHPRMGGANEKARKVGCFCFNHARPKSRVNKKICREPFAIPWTSLLATGVGIGTCIR